MSDSIRLDIGIIECTKYQVMALKADKHWPQRTRFHQHFQKISGEKQKIGRQIYED
jgi:hypothetical protein